ncbi:MAG: hypothetical protein WCI22_04260, partial [Actinomycetota bacterium]
MQAASASGASGGPGKGNMVAKRWGPIVAVVVVIAVGVGVLLATRGDSKSSTSPSTSPSSAPSTTVASGATTTAAGGVTTSAAPAVVTFPMSFSQAKAVGLEKSIDWGSRCDTTTGRVKVPDYFAPECFAPFKGDNGGATTPGVTGSEITVVNYQGQAGDPIIAYISDAVRVSDTNAQQFATLKELFRYYETYYETYGRKIKLINYEGTGIANDEVAARADAAAIAEKYKPFIVLGGPALTSAFGDELAARKIMCIGCTPAQPADFYTKRDPYVWGLDGSAIQKQTHVLEFIQKQLVGKNASHAGDTFKNTPRKFGLLYLESSGASKDLADAFTAAMQKAGAPLAQTVAYKLDPSTIQQTASQVITKMKSAGVTTIIFAGDPVAPRDFTKEATGQEYFPEWVIAASTLVDVTAFGRTYDQQQWAHAFGVTQLAARTDPTKFGAYSLYKWFTGQVPPAPGTVGLLTPNPSLLFAVVQGVGPKLTPQTFRDGLFKAKPTTPGISQPYLTYGDKGYWGGVPDYQGVDDATAIWWNPPGPSTFSSTETTRPASLPPETRVIRSVASPSPAPPAF